MFADPIPLTDSQLMLANTLPVKPASVTLAGRYVRLEPLSVERDVQALHAMSNGSPAVLGERTVSAYDPDETIWRYMSGGPFGTASDLAAWLAASVDAPNGLCFCVFDRATNHQIGVTNYMNNFPQHLKIELGGIWYSPLAQRSHTNTEATYLMLRHAFTVGYRRLEWKCDALNERSRRAALRMGFTFEGIQDYHFIVKGRNRDTAWFRILDREWPQVSQHIEALLYADHG